MGSSKNLIRLFLPAMARVKQVSFNYYRRARHAKEQARQEELSKAQPDSDSSDEDSEEVEATSEDDSNIEKDVVTMAEQEATTTK